MAARNRSDSNYFYNILHQQSARLLGISIIFPQFFPELADERGLSIVKQKGLLEHLMRTSSHGELGNSPQRSRSGMRRSKTQLDSLTALRKKDQIIQSGAYERSPAAPPKGRGICSTSQTEIVTQLLLFSNNNPL